MQSMVRSPKPAPHQHLQAFHTMSGSRPVLNVVPASFSGAQTGHGLPLLPHHLCDGYTSDPISSDDRPWTKMGCIEFRVK